MAKNNLIVATAFFLVFLFAYGITFTEERHLLKADHQLDESAKVHVTNVMSSSHKKNNMNRANLEDASTGNVNATAYDTDDFRPTTPGHSPGAGHSTGPTSTENN